MTNKEQNQAETSLVKINSELYDRVKKKVKSNSIMYPSIKSFIEKATLQKLEGQGSFKVFDDLFSGKIKLTKNSKNFTLCLACGKAFLKEKKDKDKKSKICPNCQKLINYFSNETTKKSNFRLIIEGPDFEKNMEKFLKKINIGKNVKQASILIKTSENLKLETLKGIIEKISKIFDPHITFIWNSEIDKKLKRMIIELSVE